MERYLKLALNQFEPIPVLLQRGPPGDASAVGEIIVDLAGLYHHYYLDSYGQLPPSPDPAQFEYLRFLCPTPEFRLAGNGIGDSTVMRRHASTSLGQAFCRWFLHKYLGFTYFSHMQHMMGRSPRRGIGGLRIVRSREGDVPDYVCARSTRDVALAEAKGRYPSISFKSQEFAAWRKQFERVEVRDSAQRLRKLKGYIVGTRFATEESSPRVFSTLFAEDPESPGEEPPSEEEMRTLGAATLACHYGNIATKLNQPTLAAALLSGTRVPDQIGFLATIWKFQQPPLEGQRFVGGYYPFGQGALPYIEVEGGIARGHTNSLRLDIRRGTFFGVEESIFQEVIRLARLGRQQASEVHRYEQIEPFYSGISVLRDGSMVAPLDFLVPVQEARF